MLRLGINGYGRIGRCVLRALHESPLREAMRIVAINEPADTATMAHLTRYDTTHGRFGGEVAAAKGGLDIAGQHIAVTHITDVDALDWSGFELDVLLECSGAFSSRAIAERHIAAGAPRLLFSQPAEPDVDATIISGINDDVLTAGDTIISAASCTTNAVVPPIRVLHDAFGIEHGVITTIHSAMNDQPVLDAYHHTDLRKTRSAMQSIIPIDTGLARGIGRVLPELAGRFEAQAMRVPTIDVSAMDLSVYLAKPATTEAVNTVLREAANGALGDVLGYTEEPLASCDFVHDCHSGIIDASQTRVAGNRLAKVLVWFDNEWGYANRMLDVIHGWSRLW